MVVVYKISSNVPRRFKQGTLPFRVEVIVRRTCDLGNRSQSYTATSLETVATTAANISIWIAADLVLLRTQIAARNQMDLLKNLLDLTLGSVTITVTI